MFLLRTHCHKKSMAMSVRCVDMLCHVFAILMLLRRLLHDRGSGAMAKRGSCVIVEPVDPLWEEYALDVGCLGKGSNGKVLRAYARSGMTIRALKCVDGRFAKEEADILKSLAHSNIIPLLKISRRAAGGRRVSWFSRNARAISVTSSHGDEQISEWVPRALASAQGPCNCLLMCRGGPGRWQALWHICTEDQLCTGI